jgi:hypothetical protein
MARIPSTEHLPSALSRWRLYGTACPDRPPVGCNEIKVHAKPLKKVRGYVALGLGDRLVLGHEAGHRLARITRLRQQLLRCIKITRSFQYLAALLGIERGARREETWQGFRQCGVIADLMHAYILPAERHQHGPARPHVVEGRV